MRVLSATAIATISEPCFSRDGINPPGLLILTTRGRNTAPLGSEAQGREAAQGSTNESNVTIRRSRRSRISLQLVQENSHRVRVFTDNSVSGLKSIVLLHQPERSGRID